MTEIQFFYRIETLQVDAAFRGCKTGSNAWSDPGVYREVNVEDPPYTVSRDHKVVLDDEGLVVDTEPSTNPVQPTETPNPNQDVIDQLRGLWPTLSAAEKRELIRRVLVRLLGG